MSTEERLHKAEKTSFFGTAHPCHARNSFCRVTQYATSIFLIPYERQNKWTIHFKHTRGESPGRHLPSLPREWEHSRWSRCASSRNTYVKTRRTDPLVVRYPKRGPRSSRSQTGCCKKAIGDIRQALVALPQRRVGDSKFAYTESIIFDYFGY